MRAAREDREFAAAQALCSSRWGWRGLGRCRRRPANRSEAVRAAQSCRVNGICCTNSKGRHQDHSRRRLGPSPSRTRRRRSTGSEAQKKEEMGPPPESSSRVHPRRKPGGRGSPRASPVPDRIRTLASRPHLRPTFERSSVRRRTTPASRIRAAIGSRSRRHPPRGYVGAPVRAGIARGGTGRGRPARHRPGQARRGRVWAPDTPDHPQRCPARGRGTSPASPIPT